MKNVFMSTKDNGAVDQTNKFEQVSTQFRMQNTRELINKIEGNGFNLVGHTEVNTRKEEKRGFQKHLVLFEHDKFIIDGDNKFNLLLTNSHCGDSSLRLNLGIYRAICSNGLVVGDSMYETRIPHKGNDFYHKIDESLEVLWERLPDIAAKIGNMKNTLINQDLMLEFFKSVSNQLLGDKIKDESLEVNLDSFRARRLKDCNNNVFNVYNRAQETAMKGGLKYKTTIIGEDGKAIVKNSSTRRVRGIDRHIELNKFIWDQAENMLQAA